MKPIFEHLGPAFQKPHLFGIDYADGFKFLVDTRGYMHTAHDATSVQLCAGNGVCAYNGSCLCSGGYAGAACTACAAGYVNVAAPPAVLCAVAEEGQAADNGPVVLPSSAFTIGGLSPVGAVLLLVFLLAALCVCCGVVCVCLRRRRRQRKREAAAAALLKLQQERQERGLSVVPTAVVPTPSKPSSVVPLMPSTSPPARSALVTRSRSPSTSTPKKSVRLRDGGSDSDDDGSDDSDA